MSLSGREHLHMFKKVTHNQTSEATDLMLKNKFSRDMYVSKKRNIELEN